MFTYVHITWCTWFSCRHREESGARIFRRGGFQILRCNCKCAYVSRQMIFFVVRKRQCLENKSCSSVSFLGFRAGFTPLGYMLFIGNFEIAQYENWSYRFLFKMFIWKVRKQTSGHGGRCLCQCLPLPPFILMNF